MADDLDRERFIKILMLSQSESDGEALNALRMANKLLKKAGLNWEGFLSNPRDSHSVAFGFKKKISSLEYQLANAVEARHIAERNLSEFKKRYNSTKTGFNIDDIRDRVKKEHIWTFNFDEVHARARAMREEAKTKYEKPRPNPFAGSEFSHVFEDDPAADEK